METQEILRGFAIVVVDRGFIYIGDVEHDGTWCVITHAQNIRRWGTSEGLGELANNGPLENTKLDRVGTVRVPARAVISIIDTEKSKWNCS